MAAALEDLEDIITCEVCYNRFDDRDPRSLPCLHVFCLACIQDIHDAASNNQNKNLKPDEFRCPKCQAVTTIPGTSVSNYPKFFHANQIKEAYKNLKKKASPFTCHLCTDEKSVVEAYCFTCQKTFCNPCMMVHDRNKKYFQHVHVQVKKDKMQALVCSEHKDMVKAYCLDCGQLVCDKCQLSSHAEHDIHEFTTPRKTCTDPSSYLYINVNQNPKSKVDDRMSDLNAKCESLSQRLFTIDLMQEEFNACITFAEDQITEQKEKLMTEILGQEQSMKDELERYRTEQNAKLENARQKVAKLVEKSTKQIPQIIQPIPEIPSITLQCKQELLSELRRDIFDANHDVLECDQYVFKPEASIIHLGRLSKLNEGKDTQPQLPVPPKRPEAHRKEIPNTPSGLEGAPKQKLGQRLSQQDDIQRILPPKEIAQIASHGQITGIDWTSEGDILMAAGFKLIRYNIQGKHLTPSENIRDVEGDVFSVATYQPTATVAAVATRSDEYFLYISSLNKGQWKTRKYTLVDQCHSVMFTRDGDLLLSVGENLLLKCDTQGYKLWDSDIKHFAHSIAVDLGNNIIISGDNKKMSRYDKSGKWLSSFPSNRSLLSKPTGVCVDSKRNIYVADHARQAVLAFTPEGHYVREVVKLKGMPKYIALHQDRYLCVAFTYSMSIFDLGK